MRSLRRIFTLTARNVKEILRDPLALVFLFALPLVMLVGFYFVFHTLAEQFSMQYLAPGMVGFGTSFLALFVGLLYTADKTTAFSARLAAMPVKNYEYVLGFVLATLPLAAVQSILFFATACVIDPSFFSARLLLAILLSLPVSLLFIGCGLLFGEIASEKSVGGLCSVMIVGQSVLSGMWFPLQGMSEGFLLFMKILPFRNITLIMQNVCAGENIGIPLLIVAAYAVAVNVAAVLVRKIKRGRSDS